MKRFIFNLVFFFIINYSLLYSTDDLPILNFDGGAVSIVNGCVSVLTGDYIEKTCDVEVVGPEKLTFERTFCSSDDSGSLYGWFHNHESKVLEYGNDWLYKNREGRCITYTASGNFIKAENKNYTNSSSGVISGRTHIRNTRLKVGHNHVSVESENDSRKHFIYSKNNFFINKEEKFNGNVLKYKYNNDECELLKSVKSRDSTKSHLFGEITLNYITEKALKAKLFITVKTSDSRRVGYKLKRFKGDKEKDIADRYRIEEVNRPSAPTLKYVYECSGPYFPIMICKKELPEGRFQNIEYGYVSEFKVTPVKQLFAPVGYDKNPVKTHEFVYNKTTDQYGDLIEGKTEVFDAEKNLTVYEYDINYRISEVRKYRGTKYSTEQFYWSEEGNLLYHLQKDENNSIYAAKALTYDKRHNVIENTFYGDLQGLKSTISFEKIKKKNVLKGTDSLSTQYFYNKKSLLLEERHPNGKSIHYTYDKDRDLVLSKLTSEKGIVKIREFYEYDQFALLTRVIKDDGARDDGSDLTYVTERFITKTTNQQFAPYGLPIQIEEYYLDLATGQEVFLKKIKNLYSRLGHLILKETYDAQDVLRYQERFEYDEHGNVTLEENALGQITTKQYNANDECIYEKCQDQAFHKENVYDFAGRRIATKEIHEDGTNLVTSFEYNILNQLVAKIDPCGQRTEYVNDVFGNKIKTTLPTYTDPTGVSITATTFSKYDFFGNEISKTDVFGKTTRFSKNVRGKPTQIISPDGSTETMEYETDGTLRKTIGKNGLITHTTHDCFGRLLTKECYSSNGEFLSKISSTYNSFHKLTDVDANGTVTEYTYTPSGFLRSTKKENSLTEYFYDEFQRLTQVKQWVSENSYLLTTKTFDFLNREIEERVEDEKQHCHKLEQYKYDVYGNKTEMLQQRPNGISITKTCYDSQNRPIKTTDPEGNVTHFSYTPIYHNGQQVIEIESQDALGILTITRMNIFGKPESIIKKNGYGDIIAKKEIGYDAAQNVTFTIETAVTIKTEKNKDEKEHTFKDKEILTKWIYNEQNLPITLIEAAGTPEQKVTEYRYNSMGEKIQIIKHDGIIIENTYDDFGRLKSFKSSDDSLSYAYEYDLNGNVVKSIDLINDQITFREYDLSDKMVKEILGTSLEVNYTYDFMGRPIQVRLPDGSSIVYEYNPHVLSKVTRFSKESLEVYTHTYNEYDLSGNLLNETKPLSIGDCDYQYNLNGKLSNIDSQFFSEKIYYDTVNNITSCEIGNTSQNINSKYTYDDLSQLSSEDGVKTHHYINDSLFNCLEKDGKKQDTNYLNQLIKTVDQTFQYDKSGNRIADGQCKYSYDALDRLTSVISDTQVFTYTYDSFNRRLSKSTNNQKTDFLYFGQNEVGSYVNGILKEFRALGTGKGAEIGASIALELQNQIYIPIHDHNGNIVSLIDANGQTVENYRYSAYGEEKIYDAFGNEIDHTINPWRFSSKRMDAETGLINFGRRYYDCKTAKWLSPDPIGFEGGPNLYAYVNNSPLSHFDLYGLEAYTFSYNFSREGYKPSPYNYSDMYSSTSCASRAAPSYCSFNHITYDDKYEDRWKNKSRNMNLSEYNKVALPYFNVGFTNGICNTFGDAMQSGSMLSKMAGGIDINVTYAATHGFVNDIDKCMMGLHQGIATPAVRLLQRAWTEFAKNAPEGAQYLQYCHSYGAINVRNALMDMPEHIRQRIHIVAIAPAAYIEAKYCASVIHYVSTRDAVPLFDRKGAIACRDNIRVLTPHKDAPEFDHAFSSPTYRKVINDRLLDFTSQYGDMNRK